MTTCENLVDECRRLLFSGQRETLNSLSSALTDTTGTSLALTYDLGPLTEGSYVTVDLEIMYVWAISGLAATVQRGVLGSTAATHLVNSVVYVNSKFPAFSIFQSLNADLADLSSPGNGLFQVVDVDLTYNPAIQGYDLGVTTDLIDVLAVRAQTVGPSNDWVPIKSYRIETDGESTSFASGFGIILYEGGYPGRTIRVSYSAPFAAFTALADDVSVTGLPTTAYDLPALGAGMRLTGVREIQRNFNESQGTTRRATEVPPNAQLAGYSALARERQRRIKSESDRLASTWPVKRKGL